MVRMVGMYWSLRANKISSMFGNPWLLWRKYRYRTMWPNNVSNSLLQNNWWSSARQYVYSHFISLLSIYSDLEYCSMFENTRIIKSRIRRVVNGVPVENSWDWIVRLDFFTDLSSDQSSLCSGTVIHKNFILTAGHCCRGKNSVLMTFKDCRKIFEKLRTF